MKKTREILRLSWQHKISQEKTRIACGVSKSTVWETLNRARLAGLFTWNDVEALSDEQLDEKVFPPQQTESENPLPDWDLVHKRLRTEKYCTRQQIWEEYRLTNNGAGLGFSQFCELYRSWVRGLSLVMRQEHHPGEKLFVDYAGDKIIYWDRVAGEQREAHLFVAVLGYSNYTFARATADETRNSWLSCHVAAFSFLGGAPHLVVPDNPRTLVNKTCIYDPDINPAYTEMALHYGTAVLPARPRKLRDKALMDTQNQPTIDTSKPATGSSV